MPLRRRGPAPRHRGKEQLSQWRRPWPPRAEQARARCPRRAPHRRAPKERVEHELQVVRLLSAGSGVTVTETVGTFSRPLLGATRSRAVCGNPRSMQIATRWSAMLCGAACGDAGTHSVARERCHTAKNLSRMASLLCVKPPSYTPLRHKSHALLWAAGPRRVLPSRITSTPRARAAPQGVATSAGCFRGPRDHFGCGNLCLSLHLNIFVS